MPTLHNPVPAPERPRAKDLRNKPLLVNPGAYEEVPSTRDDTTWRYYDCKVIVLGKDGIESRSDGVRISWSRAIPQLSAVPKGEWLACRPVEGAGGGVVLEPLNGDARVVAEQVLSELDGE